MEQEEDYGDLEFLVKFEVYKCKFMGLSRTSSFYDKNPDPKMMICPDFMKGFENPYFGYLVYNKNILNPFKEKEARESNIIRQNLISGTNLKKMINAKIVGMPKNGDPAGPYNLVAVGQHYIDTNKPLIENPLTAKEALSVLKGEKVFYAQYCPTSEKQKDYFLRIFTEAWEVKTGYVYIGKSHDLNGNFQLKKKSDRSIAKKILYGSDKNQKIIPGDCMLVRKVGQLESGRFEFEPVVNFVPEDNALTPEGYQLITRVEGKYICDLPILYNEIKNGKEFAGVGYINKDLLPKKTNYSEKNYEHFYNKVFVMGSEKDVHKYTRISEMFINDDIIFTRKVR